MATDPRLLAKDIITAVIKKGSNKDGANEEWRKKSALFHLGKGLEHALRHQNIVTGIRPPESENHLELALTRFAMALVVTKDTKEGADKWGS